MKLSSFDRWTITYLATPLPSTITTITEASRDLGVSAPLLFGVSFLLGVLLTEAKVGVFSLLKGKYASKSIAYS